MRADTRTSALLNSVTQGATLFAGVTSFFAVTSLDFRVIIVFDTLTFLANGLLIYSLPIHFDTHDNNYVYVRRNYFIKFYDLFFYNRRNAALDLFLAIALCGTTTLDSRIANNDLQILAGLFAIYGLAVWISAWVSKFKFVKIKIQYLWLCLGFSFLYLTNAADNIPEILGVSFIKNLFYWLILHHISANIQHDTPINKYGSVYNARMIMMTGILALGEFLVGYLSRFAPITAEGWWRMIVCLGAVFYSLQLKSEKVL
jgi:hypothetical protein